MVCAGQHFLSREVAEAAAGAQLAALNGALPSHTRAAHNNTAFRFSGTLPLRLPVSLCSLLDRLLLSHGCLHRKTDFWY